MKQANVYSSVPNRGEGPNTIYIEVQGGISFLFHENQCAGGNFSTKLISVPARLFGTL